MSRGSMIVVRLIGKVGSAWVCHAYVVDMRQ